VRFTRASARYTHIVMASSFLISLAEMSHVAALTSVLTGTFLMVLFILKFMGQDILEFGRDDPAVTRVELKPAQIEMQPKPVPCWVKSITSDEDTVVVRLGSRGSDAAAGASSLLVRAYWGVTVTAFHHILGSPWSWFRQAFTSPAGNLFGAEGCVLPGQIAQHNTGDEIYLELHRPKDKPELRELGPAPRKSYPLVLVVLPERGGTKGEDGEALLVAVHLPDAVCRVTAHALATYCKDAASGRCVHLVPVFSQIDAECVVCQERKVSRCLLPCKHACACHICFQQLRSNRCPMCRTFITSYFVMGDDDVICGEEEERDLQASTSESAAVNRTRSTHLVRRIVQAFNVGIGIREHE